MSARPFGTNCSFCGLHPTLKGWAIVASSLRDEILLTLGEDAYATCPRHGASSPVCKTELRPHSDSIQSRLVPFGWFDSVKRMRSQFVVVWLLVFLAARGFGAEKKFDFSEVREGEPPAGFRSAVTGEGKPGKWVI